MSDISREKVCSEIQHFWSILTGASPDKLEDLYSSSAIIFTGTGKRSEHASLVSMRRMRQRPAGGTTSNAEVGQVDVQIVTPDVAIATYTYKFHSSTTGEDGSRVQRRTLFGRATHIFQRDRSGALRIVHEHLSSASPPKIEKAARE
jgi:ketosteroid isomerase-like protein